MKQRILLLIAFGFILIPAYLAGQTKNDAIKSKDKKDEEINNIEFKTDKVYLEDKLCFNYFLHKGEFSIMDINNKDLITGKITATGPGEFSSVIHFLTIDMSFHNDKIIGRNDIILALVDNLIIDRNCNIDNEKLLKFVKENNQLETD